MRHSRYLLFAASHTKQAPNYISLFFNIKSKTRVRKKVKLLLLIGVFMSDGLEINNI
jgi:hypothetical protein